MIMWKANRPCLVFMSKTQWKITHNETAHNVHHWNITNEPEEWNIFAHVLFPPPWVLFCQVRVEQTPDVSIRTGDPFYWSLALILSGIFTIVNDSGIWVAVLTSRARGAKMYTCRCFSGALANHRSRFAFRSRLRARFVLTSTWS